ncbi:MAG: phosphate ABC transporter permease PstA [Fidelibacterota bacterium]
MLRRKRVEEQIFKSLGALATYLIIAVLLYLIIVILKNGCRALDWDMLSQVPRGGFYFGEEGGILNAIIGSFYLAIGATVLAFLIGLPVALFMNVHLIRHCFWLNRIRFFLDVLWGVPSIVYGAFGFSVMLFLGLRASLLAGILTVTLLIVPIMIRSIDEVLKTVPKGLLESSYALGSTRSEVALKVYIRQALPGIVTAILLSFGRGIGDAASVLFTAGYTDYIPTSLSQPTATLPLAIFFQLSSPIPAVRERAYASAVVLTVIILIVSLTARFISAKYRKHVIK